MKYFVRCESYVEVEAKSPEAALKQALNKDSWEIVKNLECEIEPEFGPIVNAYHIPDSDNWLLSWNRCVEHKQVTM